MFKPYTIETPDLHALLDSLTGGEHVKATWEMDQFEFTVEGPVTANGKHRSCRRIIRWTDGGINSSLTSFEVTRDEDVTVTRDDEEALRALIDSLEGGERITAEWRNQSGLMTVTGTTITDAGCVWVHGPVLRPSLRGLASGSLSESLYSVTVRRTITQRWERDGDESLHARTH